MLDGPTSFTELAASGVPVLEESLVSTALVWFWLKAPVVVSLLATGLPTTLGVITALTSWPSSS